MESATDYHHPKMYRYPAIKRNKIITAKDKDFDETVISLI
jgi:hypothetical protein